MSVHNKISRKTVADIIDKKRSGEKNCMLTCYDYTMAKIIDACDIDMILVGDSASNVMCGNETTLPITLDEMIFLTRGVVRGNTHALVICDMPFGSYQVSEEVALHSAIRIIKETGAQAVKIEGGSEIYPLIKHLIQIGIPVCGHIGLTPQSVNQLSGYTLQGVEKDKAERLIDDAVQLSQAGCFAIVLEKIPAGLAKQITDRLSSSGTVVIGIGAGQYTDGQVLVLQDMLGMNEGFKPKFLRRFGDVGQNIKNAVNNYIDAVHRCEFPSINESY